MTRGPQQRLDDIADAITRIRAAMAVLDAGVPDPQADSSATPCYTGC